MFIPEKIYLIDTDESLVKAWKRQFSQYTTNVEAHVCDYFDHPADCMVSPANSFGYMDGGLDRIISYEFGDKIQERVQSAIVEEFHGELPIGSSVLVKTGSEKWPYLVAAPTMRVPENVSDSFNAYIAFRAILLKIKQFNSAYSQKMINSLVCSGLGTGIGEISAAHCALQMRMAYEVFLKTPRILTPREIYTSHNELKSNG